MSEFAVYGKNGLFHSIIKQSAILNGRYAVLPKGAHDLNISSLISGLEIPSDSKYPGVFCLPPTSEIESVQQGWAEFYFRLLFLTTTYATGDNKIKFPDPLTNTSLHSVDKDWSDMAALSTEFMYALEQLQPRTMDIFRVGQKEKTRMARISKMQNDNLSGVMISFYGYIPLPCEFDDINLSAIVIPIETHEAHYH